MKRRAFSGLHLDTGAAATFLDAAKDAGLILSLDDFANQPQNFKDYVAQFPPGAQAHIGKNLAQNLGHPLRFPSNRL